jgi:gliding motility-associated-like protein
MINLKSFFFSLLLLFTAQIYSQSSCPNSDFESGTFSGWQGRTGACCPIATFPSRIVPGVHTIMSGTGTDPNTCDVVHVVAPGGTFSARLGNEEVGAQAEALSYRITVTPSSLLFIYRYAVVLQDFGHAEEEQPRFQVRVLDATGQLIDPVCGEYAVIARDGLTGFQTCPHPDGDVRYRDWTTVGLNLSDYLGQTLTIEFETGDCQHGGHFGYAYIDAYCSPLSIGSTYCSNATAAELTAPVGFNYVWSTGASTQSIIVNNPTAGSVYTCTLISATGCAVDVTTVLQLEDPIADFIITNTCSTNAVFQDTTVLVNPSLLDNYLWEFGDGSTSNVHNPSHYYLVTGTYTVKFTAFNAFGCSTTATKTITVYLAPRAQITYGQTTFCTTDTIVKNVLLRGTNDYTGGTYSADLPGLSINPVTGDFTPSTSTGGTYKISYAIPTANGCTVLPATTTITIIQGPHPIISYSAASFCNIITALQGVRLTGTGPIYGGAYSSSPSGLYINSFTGNIDPSRSAPGNYRIFYTILPENNVCDPVSVTTNVIITSASAAAISYASPFCNLLTLPQAVNLTGTGAFSAGVYNSYPAGLHLNTATGEITPSLSSIGNYTVEYIIPNSGGCTGVTITTTVSITNRPTAAISYADPFCNSISTAMPVTLTGTGAFSGGFYTAPAGVAINSSTGGITPIGSAVGTHQIVYTIPTTLGCISAPVSTSVTILPVPEPILSNFSICEDPTGHVFRPALLNTGLSDPLYSCQWFFNGAPIPGVTSNQYSAAVEGIYSVLATNRVTGCVSIEASASVSTAVTVEDFITYVSNTFSNNTTLTIVVPGGTGPYLFSIDNSPFQASNVFSELNYGIHNVTITDVNNCTDVTKRIMVLGFPAYFSPNGDGNNDFWNIYHFNTQPDAKIFIYDRYGKLLTQLNPLGPGWNGTYNGKMMPSTDYWFLVEYKDYDETGEMVWQSFKSHFSMVR